MIDGIAGKIVGDIHYPTIGSITAGTKVQLGTTELTSTFTPPSNNTGQIGTTALRFGTGYFQNINASGNITASTFNGTLNGILIGDQIGSVFGDDSTLLVDGVNGKIVGEINTTSKIFQTMDGTDSGIEIKGISTGSPGPDLKYSASRGTIASPAILQAADTIMDVVPPSSLIYSVVPPEPLSDLNKISPSFIF